MQIDRNRIKYECFERHQRAAGLLARGICMKRTVRILLAAAAGVLLIYAAFVFLSAERDYSRMEERLSLLRMEAEKLRKENELLEERIFRTWETDPGGESTDPADGNNQKREGSYGS